MSGRDARQLAALARCSTVRVGKGRGFVWEDGDNNSYIITAARCLSELPKPHAAVHPHGRTYSWVVAPIGEDTSVCAECAFIDPIAAIAVLTQPNESIGHPDVHKAYDLLLGFYLGLRIGNIDAPTGEIVGEPMVRL
jgi:hypothetical protein